MGTHGSLTKAGKVRSLTPKIDPMPHPPTNPKKRNRINYKKEFEDDYFSIYYDGCDCFCIGVSLCSNAVD